LYELKYNIDIKDSLRYKSISKIKILLSCKGELQKYVDAVNGVGAEVKAEYMPMSDIGYDGLILCGGSDIDPKLYNEEVNGSVGINTEREGALTEEEKTQWMAQNSLTVL